jgi:hypothetical protein
MPNKDIIDLSERPSFWLPGGHTLRNSIVGIPANLAMINIQKYSTRILALLIHISKVNAALVKKLVRITPLAYRTYHLEKLFKIIQGRYPNFFTEEEIDSLNNGFRPFNFGYDSPASRDYLEEHWLKNWNKVHESIRKDTYEKSK